MKFTLTHFIIAVIITSLFYLSLHLAFLEGALVERKSKICVGTFELSKIEESTKFFNDIYSLQQEEVKILRSKIEQNIKDLSACYNKNTKLQSDYDKLLTQ